MAELRLPEAPACEAVAPVLLLRFSAPELGRLADGFGEGEQRPEEWCRQVCGVAGDLNFALALQAPPGRSFHLSRVLGQLFASLRSEGIEVSAFDLGVPRETAALDAKVEAALEATALRSKYYSELRSLIVRSAEAVSNMRAQCLKELNRLREELRALRNDSSRQRDDVAFFSPDAFLPPSWDMIMHALDELRWGRMKPRVDRTAPLPPFRRLSAVFQCPRRPEDATAAVVNDQDSAAACAGAAASEPPLAATTADAATQTEISEGNSSDELVLLTRDSMVAAPRIASKVGNGVSRNSFDDVLVLPGCSFDVLVAMEQRCDASCSSRNSSGQSCPADSSGLCASWRAPSWDTIDIARGRSHKPQPEDKRC